MPPNVTFGSAFAADAIAARIEAMLVTLSEQGMTLVQQQDGLLEQLPLLKAVTAILAGAEGPERLVADAALPKRVNF